MIPHLRQLRWLNPPLIRWSGLGRRAISRMRYVGSGCQTKQKSDPIYGLVLAPEFRLFEHILLIFRCRSSAMRRSMRPLLLATAIADLMIGTARADASDADRDFIDQLAMAGQAGWPTGARLRPSPISASRWSRSMAR